MRGEAAFQCVIDNLPTRWPIRVIDIGAGWRLEATRRFAERGATVVAVDPGLPGPLDGLPPSVAVIRSELHSARLGLGGYDLAWCCHTLEHALDPHTFLQDLFATIRPGGSFAITVPPLKHEIVGGHVNLFNMGLLLYRLILAGADCSEAVLFEDGYDLSVVSVYRPIEPKSVDIAELAGYFPYPVTHGFDGRRLH